MFCFEHDVLVGVILHYFEDLYLNELETTTIAVDQVTEKVQKF